MPGKTDKIHRDDIARNRDSAWHRIGFLEQLLIDVARAANPEIWNHYARKYGMPLMQEDGSFGTDNGTFLGEG